MDNKRKASANVAGRADSEDRAAKRQKVPVQLPPPQSPQDFDLSQGESPESTTTYGLLFLEQIRRTTDKNGRPVAVHFENLPARSENEEYYATIRMPISLAIIERKLKDREFSNLGELEGYLKRMVANAKEYYSRSSQIFEDAERVRKALSNYMVKTNPSYRTISGYSCQPTPILTESESVRGGLREDKEDADGGEGEDDGSDAEADIEEDAVSGKEADDEEEEGDGEEGEEERKEDDGADDNDEEEDDDDDDDSDVAPRARRGSRRSQRNSAQNVQKPPEKGKPDHDYQDIRYKGLSFQQAQEKIVEEMIRKEDQDEPGWARFQPFLNLPPRTLKEYFSIITDPLSLRALQKLVKGIHGRQPATGVSDFKTWAAFEEKASLLWNNAHYFNEEGSSIYSLATELKEFFGAQLAGAKAVVPEPSQPKIKLKVPSAQDSPAPAPPKKITIHVGGSRSSTAASPAPPTGQAGEPVMPDLAQARASVQRTAAGVPSPSAPGAATASQPAPARSVSAAAASPSPSQAGVKNEPVGTASPAAIARPDGTPAPSITAPDGAAVGGQPVQQHKQPSPPNADVQRVPFHPPKPLYETTYRFPGRSAADALITNLVIRTHPGIHVDKRFTLELPAHPKLAQQSVTTIFPSNQYKLQVIPKLAPLEQQQRQYRLFAMLNGNPLTRSAPFPIPGDDLQLTANTLVFDASLLPGVNWIEVHVIAALPGGQRLPNGADCELEKMLVVAHLLR